ncbi:MAG: hypothetical protein WAK16_05790 [Candidatus Cybelea sp.]
MLHTSLLLAAVLTASVPPPHALDYQFGAWRVHVSRLVDPASPHERWVQYDGTHVVTPLVDGKANIGVLEIAGPAGSIEGLQLRTFDPSTGRWKLWFASGTDGEVQAPSIGRVDNGEGVFFERTRVGGRPAHMRTVSTRLTETTYRDVISYTLDGNTWHPSWIASYTKIPGAERSDPAGRTLQSAGDFDFQIGAWHVEFQRLARRLAGSHDWFTYSGSLVVQRLWNGRANVGELDVRHGTDRIETILLRTYNRRTGQWSDYSVDTSDGSVLFPPAVGRFSAGRGELYDREMYAGRNIVVRYVFDDITARSSRFVQSFSADDGKTWEPNAMALFTKIESP